VNPLVGALVLGLSSLNAPMPPCLSPVPDSELVHAGALVMATNPTLRPLQFVDSAGALQGMRIELGEAIAKRLCLKPEYVRMEFSTMIPGLQVGRWDMINTGIFWTEQRAGMMQMINYEYEAISISVAHGNALGIAKPDDLAGRSVGVEFGSFEENKLRQLNQSLVDRGMAPIAIHTFDNFAAAFQAMSAGQTDATVSIDPTAAEYARYGGVDRVISGLFPTPVALAMKSRALSAAVVAVLNDMQRDGTYPQLMARYGLAAHSGPFIVNGPEGKSQTTAPQEQMKSGWSWRGFFHYLINGYLLMGALTTLMLTSAAIVGGLCVGSMLAWLRLARRRWLTLGARVYIWIFRGTPLLVQLIIIYTGLPQIGIKLSVIESALIGLILNEAAYLAEIIRGGILAVPAGQSDAGRALGLSSAQVMMHIVLPQAARIIIPTIGNSVNGMLKTTAVTSVISMEELLRRTQLLIQDRFMVLELFAVASIYYLLMTSAWNVVQRRIETHFGRAQRTIALSNVH
jgi:His/Glu/Gln/Arg/opine family amino acid ABC transporter permease subunit